MAKISGIYKIIHKRSTLYVGATTSLRHRRKNEFYRLRSGISTNKMLQKFYDRGGRDLKFVLIEECPPCDHVERKQFFIHSLSPKFNKKCQGIN